MPPRNQRLPEATTESAREARKAFFCDLCQKGYARMNDFEAHEGSYDHQHRKRLKDLKNMTKDPNAAARAREAEAKRNEEAGLKSVSISLPGASSTGAIKKKPVFKSTLQPQNASVVPSKPLEPTVSDPEKQSAEDPDGSIRNGWAQDRYTSDPNNPLYPDFSVKLTDLMKEEEVRDHHAELDQWRAAGDPRWYQREQQERGAQGW